MDYFRNIVVVAALAGAIAGLGMTIAQQLTTVPLILKAETYEGAAPAHDHGNAAASHQHEGGRALPGFLKDRPGQQRIVPLAGLTAVGRKMLLGAEQAPFGVPTARAYEPLGVEIPLQPEGADAIIHQLGNREINHAPSLAHPAR